MTTQGQKASTKRILSVTIKRMTDESPDTSYSDSADSEYSIDRKHSLDCPINAASFTDTHDFDESDGICRKCGEDDASEACSESCTCNERGDMERGTYRYFNPSSNYKDETPENIRKYTLQDYKRMESLNRGDWCYIGIRADAEIGLCAGRTPSDSWLCQKITSGGLWGIESDSGESYLASIHVEQLAELRSQLAAIGFSKRAISAAFRDVKREGL